MPGKSKHSRRKKSRRVMGNHQRCWIWGRHAVTETLDAGKWPVLELQLSEELPDSEREPLVAAAESQGATVSITSTRKLTERCGARDHQGFIAKMPPYPYDDLETLISDAASPQLLLLLDSVQDAYNFGAILRCAEVLGAQGVFVGQKHQAEVNSLVARTSAGAVNHLKIAEGDLVAVAERLKENGVSLIAASEKGATPACAADFTEGCAIIIGNEARGIREDLLRTVSKHITIPQHGRVGSLNAAVAAGIVLYEAQRQRTAAALD